MFKKLFSKKVLKFLIGGGIAALFNLFLIFVMVEGLGWNDALGRNLANTISIELSLLVSFFIYRLWVWTGGVWNIKEVIFKQIPLYHLSAGSAVILRIFILFPILDWLKVDYRINTLIGVLLSASLNYIISDRLVFKNQLKNQQPEIFYPEGLEAALHAKDYYQAHKHNQSIELFSIVIPAYNEEEGITPTIQDISQVLTRENIPYEILVINDNSKDKTEEVLKKISTEHPQVRYINNYYPNGFGFAVRCGLENFDGDAVAIVMADSSDAPENIVDYYYKLQEGYECVFGSRFIRGGKVIDYPTHKLIINRFANTFVKVLFGLKFNDTTNAFKAYRREVIEGISPLISHHFNLTVEIPLKAIARGYSYTVIPITWTNRKTGISKLKIREMGSRYLFIVLSILLEKFLSRGDYVRQHSKFKKIVPGEK
ncbi:MAG: glycosyltransferase [Nostocales cyanobacterium]|nr:MAG: glycosyltransferase [Nostocales cyanobacterium]